MGYFPKADEVPETVVEHVRGALELAEGTGPHYESANTAKLHRKLVRERQGVSCDQERARQIAEEAVRRAGGAGEEQSAGPDQRRVGGAGPGDL
ncbi:hypothetical protein [Streptomyces sp. NPDC005181]|uniref:hypothetical protein n=1 Tax=Streptomyces sp. NPDC005181 TaxID=3156869 RepID=UPI0033B1B296